MGRNEFTILFRDMGFKCLLKGPSKARQALFITSLGYYTNGLKMVVFYDEGEFGYKSGKYVLKWS